MANFFEIAAQKIKESSIVIWIFLASVAMMLIGINHFAEDTLSSRYGIELTESMLGMIPASYDLTYWTLSLAPQIAQIVFFYLYLSNTDANKWALLVAFFWLMADFGVDSWYRSGHDLFSSPTKFFVSVMMTLIYYTIGSEGFITVGLGLSIELFPPFIKQAVKFAKNMGNALHTKQAMSQNMQIHQQNPPGGFKITKKT